MVHRENKHNTCPCNPVHNEEIPKGRVERGKTDRMHKLLPGVIRSKPEPKEDHCLSLTLGTQQQKHLEVQQKYSAARRIYNSLLGVWKCDQTLSFVFDILLTTLFGVFVVEEVFRLIPRSSNNIALVRIFINVSLTKIMNFTAADKNNQINNKRERGTRGKKKLWEESS